jgi:hypothetical protein
MNRSHRASNKNEKIEVEDVHHSGQESPKDAGYEGDLRTDAQGWRGLPFDEINVYLPRWLIVWVHGKGRDPVARPSDHNFR